MTNITTFIAILIRIQAMFQITLENQSKGNKKFQQCIVYGFNGRYFDKENEADLVDRNEESRNAIDVLPSHGKKLQDRILQYFFLVSNIFDNVLGPHEQISQFRTWCGSVYVPFD